MELWDREYYVSRIIAGESRFKIFGKTFVVKTPSRTDRYVANQVYRDIFEECKTLNIMTCDELLSLMRRKGMWDDSMDKEFDQLHKNIEDLKVGLYERYAEDNARFSIRNTIDITTKEINRLFNLKNKLDYLSCESIAASARLRHLVGSSIGYPNYDSPGEYTEEVMNKYFADKISEEQFREIARSEPWASFWSTKNHAGNGLFGLPSVDLNEEQRTLIMWSSFYESIREHPERPDDAVIEDDDALDGWVIVQRRKQKAELTKSRLDGVGEKVKNSDEVFLVAKNADDCDNIMGLNNKQGQKVIKDRWKHIEKNKEVTEGHLPDTIQKLQMQFARLEAEKMRRR